MVKKIFLISITFLVILSSFFQYSNATSTGKIYEGEITLSYRNVTVYAPAVASTDEGYVGVISTITVTIQNNGSGRVFVDTLPLTQIDMQGSARLAVKVASALVKNDDKCEINPSEYDFFFVVRTSAPIIGGPSAGAIMTVAVTSLLQNWTIDDKTVMTGMINPDGSIGSVGGIIQKIDAVYSVGATRFLLPKGQAWNVVDYAMESYGIEVVEAAYINDALRYFTGYNFSIPESDQKITTEDYIDSMMPLASTLLDEARELYENASDLLNDSNIPNYYPFYYRSRIVDFLNDAGDRLEESEEWYEQELYYSSTSKSFQSLIDSRFVSYACGYFDSDDEYQYITSLFDEATSFYDNKSDEAKNADIGGMISLQCVGAAQKRVSEAGSYLSGASNSYNNNDYLTALYKIAFAIERSKSVGWWLGISSHFNDTGEINSTMLENLAVEYVEDAEQAAAYSSVILQEIGKTSSYLDDAEDLLDSARDNLEKDYPAAALFEALEALVKANLAIEIIDADVEEKINRARESASNSISESRNIGIEPVLAVSYYEFAQSLVNESSFDSALVYYKYSGIIAGAIGFTNFSAGVSSSRYVGIPEISRPVWRCDLFRYSEYLVIMVILGGIFGLVLGLIIGSLLSKRRKEEFYKKWMPRSIDDYYKKHK